MLKHVSKKILNEIYDIENELKNSDNERRIIVGKKLGLEHALYLIDKYNGTEYYKDLQEEKSNSYISCKGV